MQLQIVHHCVGLCDLTWSERKCVKSYMYESALMPSFGMGDVLCTMHSALGIAMLRPLAVSIAPTWAKLIGDGI